MSFRNKFDSVLYIASMFFIAWIGGCSFEHYKSDREDSWDEAKKWEGEYLSCDSDKTREINSSMLYAQRAWEQMESTASCARALSECKGGKK